MIIENHTIIIVDNGGTIDTVYVTESAENKIIGRLLNSEIIYKEACLGCGSYTDELLEYVNPYSFAFTEHDLSQHYVSIDAVITDKNRIETMLHQADNMIAELIKNIRTYELPKIDSKYAT